MTRLSSVAILSLGVLSVAAAASATPTITITSPAFGTAVRNSPKPTITVAYSSSDPAAPLDLASLTVTVNGVDRTTLFTKGPDSASWTLGPNDELPGGTVSLYASIRDTATPPRQADASQSNEVLPSLQGVQPPQGDPGDTVTVTAFGLDPGGANVLLFGSLLSTVPIEAPLVTVDPVARTGTVVVPQDAATGTVSLKVNGRTSPETPYFVVNAPFHNCGVPIKMLSESDGSLVVLYDFYVNAGYMGDPLCPLAPAYAYRVIVGYSPGGATALGAYSDFFHSLWILDIALDKGGSLAVLWGTPVPGFGGIRVRVNNATFDFVDTDCACPDRFRADFDSEGNLYLSVKLRTQLTPALYALDLFKVSRDALAAGGHVIPQLIGRMLPEQPSLLPGDFRVSCDGSGYLAAWDAAGPLLRKIDLASAGAVWAVDTPEYPNSLSLTCNAGEVLGTGFVSPMGLVWRSRDGAPVELLDQVLLGGLLAVTPGGAIYTVNANGIGAIPTRVEPKIVNGTLTAQAYPCQQEGLSILPSTTRWKPQRSDDPVTVQFAGPDNLNMASGTLEIAGPAGPIMATGPITQTSPTGPFTYSMQWNGLWTYTDPVGGQVKRLPAAYYPFVVRATTATGTVQSLPFNAQNNPFARVALAEVSKVEFKECSQVPGVSCGEVGARLANNVRSDGTPMPGGGKAAFPDAVQQGGAYQRTVLVRAELTPDLGADASLVTVHFKAIDVDDPSASAAGSPIDDDSGATTSTDNRNETATPPPSVTAAEEAGVSRAIGFFKVSTQQGNNYRIAASTHEPWRTDLCGVVSSTAGAIQHAPCYPAGQGSQLSTDPSNNEVAQVSEMLTVWRTLNLELDRMFVDGAVEDLIQEQMQYNGRWTRIHGQRTLEDTAANFRDADHPRNNDWKGATLKPFAPDPGAPDPRAMDPNALPPAVFRVSSNHSTRATVGSGNLRDVAHVNSPPGSDERKYYLRDDELTSLTLGSHDLAVLRPVLETAYIRCEEHVGDAANPNPTVPFDSLLEYANQVSLPRDMQSSTAYWAVPLVLAFEGREPPNSVTGTLTPKSIATHDPVPNPPQSGTLGMTTEGDQPISATFLETLRDFVVTEASCIRPTEPLTRIQASNQAHEVLHALSLIHDGAIMCGSIKNYGDPSGYDVTEKQRATLRQILRPTFTGRGVTCGASGAPPPPDCCPQNPPTCP